MYECSFDDIQEFIANSDQKPQKNKELKDDTNSVDVSDFFPEISDDDETPTDSSVVSKISDNKLIDKLIGLRILNPKISYTMLCDLFSGKQFYSLKILQRGTNYTVDWITAAVLTHKSPQRTSKNGKPYWIWKLSNLGVDEASINLFLFSLTPQQTNLPVGSVIAVLNPEPMSQNGEFPCFTVDNYKKVLYIGQSADFGFCKGTTAKGGVCKNVINKSHGQFCVFHVQKNYKKLSAVRTELQCKMSGSLCRSNKRIGDKRVERIPPPKKSGNLNFESAVSGFTNVVSKRTRDLMSSLSKETAKAPEFLRKDEARKVSTPPIKSEIPRLNGGMAQGKIVLDDVFGSAWKDAKNAKSSNKSASDKFEDNQLNGLFKMLGDQEAMENKMSNTYEKKCNVVTCATCKYTAVGQSSLCFKLGHSVDRHESVMRFFTCRNCSSGYTQSFDKYPPEECKICKAVSWKRSSMFSTMKNKSNSKDETLQITANNFFSS